MFHSIPLKFSFLTFSHCRQFAKKFAVVAVGTLRAVSDGSQMVNETIDRAAEVRFASKKIADDLMNVYRDRNFKNMVFVGAIVSGEQGEFVSLRFYTVSKSKARLQQPEGDGRHDEEVTGRGAIHVVLEERSPGLGWRARRSVGHVLGDRGFGDVVAEQRQLGLDVRCAPEGILQRHATDQIPDLTGDLWPSSYAGLPSPVQSETPPVPAHDGVRLDDDEGGAPAPPQPGDPDPEDAVLLA